MLRRHEVRRCLQRTAEWRFQWLLAPVHSLGIHHPLGPGLHPLRKLLPQQLLPKQLLPKQLLQQQVTHSLLPPQQVMHPQLLPQQPTRPQLLRLPTKAWSWGRLRC